MNLKLAGIHYYDKLDVHQLYSHIAEWKKMSTYKNDLTTIEISSVDEYAYSVSVKFVLGYIPDTTDLEDSLALFPRLGHLEKYEILDKQDMAAFFESSRMKRMWVSQKILPEFGQDGYKYLLDIVNGT